MTDLTILCITRAQPYALPFLDEMASLTHDLEGRFYVAADGDTAYSRLDGLNATLFIVRSHGYLESVLDEAVHVCEDGYILRLDDDERVSDGMYQWLLERHYRDTDHWCFPRANLWPDENQRLDGHPVWPDLQTRLSTKEKSGGRTTIHHGSPFGSGRHAPVVIEHHKFLVRPIQDRVEQARAYERIQEGAGSGHYLPFQAPELAQHQTAPYLEVVPA